MIRFREQRGGFKESMQTVQTFKNGNGLFMYLLGKFPVQGAIIFRPYDTDLDVRNGWSRTYIVTADGLGVIGFSDGCPFVQ